MIKYKSVDNISIFCTKSCRNVVKLGIRYYQSIGIKNIQIICPKDHYKELDFNFNGVDYIFDEDLEFFDEIKKISINYGSKKNWYLQQFLKLSYWYSSPNDCLIIDGDSILSEQTLNQILIDDVLFFTNENIATYNNFIKKILNLDVTRKSYICNFCNFKYSNKDIFSNGFLNFLKLVNDLLININNDNDNGDFSEYQIHGTIENNKNSKQKALKMFRRADLFIFGPLSKINNMHLASLVKFFGSYDVICYESNHKKNTFKSIAAHIFIFLKISW